MDIEPPNVYQVLSNLQKKIAFLFQDLTREKNSYKQDSENLNIKLEQLSAESEIIKKENEALREIYDEMKNIIYAGVRLFRNADFSGVNLKREHEIELENLKKKFLDTDGKLENFESSHMGCRAERENSLECTEKSPEVNINRYAINEAEIQKEFESIKELNFSTQFFSDSDVDCNIVENEYVLNRSNAESVLKNLFERKNPCQVTKKLKDPFVVPGSEIFYPEHDDVKNSKEIKPTSKESVCNKSPVFKDFGNHRQNGIHAKEIDIISSSPSPVKLRNENFVDKPKNLIISPWKMSSHINENSPIKGCSTPKLVRKKLEITSPKRSPNAQLKKSNSREAEISVSGVRKLTQTLLNIECYKKKGLEDWKSCENRENSENKNFGIADDIIKCETKITIDTEEDDFITESPKKTDLLPDDVINRNRNENALRDVQLITPPETSGADLDETYISASIIRNCKLTKKHLLEKVTEEQTPLKRPAREKSPEYDSVPFVYKRDPVRKKAERMKLPGHACLECNKVPPRYTVPMPPPHGQKKVGHHCFKYSLTYQLLSPALSGMNKYYENALGDIDTQNLKKILNKCSRHRDKNWPTHDETPPGYWKPYLTCSMMQPKEDNA